MKKGMRFPGFRQCLEYHRLNGMRVTEDSDVQEGYVFWLKRGKVVMVTEATEKSLP